MITSPAILAALGAALLFGASTPLAKLLVGDVPPILLAGLLYLGSGIGLWLARLVRDGGYRAPQLPPGDWRWLLGAIIAGGIAGPILLMYGLQQISAGNGSLLLNLEGVFTALLAWSVFRENTDRRIVLGMALIVSGSVILGWSGAPDARHSLGGELAVALACLCWALDNNLTRRVAASDAVFIAASKGLIAGLTSLTLALALGARLPAPGLLAAALAIGLCGYGVSLVLFVVALRGLGSARTGAYFSTAPFIGAAIAVAFFNEPTSWAFWTAALLMGGGVWLHLRENHQHTHRHDSLTHTHAHRHDEHHRHSHAQGWDGVEPHSHEHQHQPLQHSHPHYPDLHHRHKH